MASTKYYKTPQEEAERLGVDISWIYRRVRMKGKDRLPHRKCGKYIRLVQEETDKYLEDHTE